MTRQEFEAQYGNDGMMRGWVGPRFKYGFTNRPFGIGCQPKGFLIDSYDGSERIEIDGKRSRYGTIEYPFRLTTDELYSFELIDLN
jgi:hypothetical protein